MIGYHNHWWETENRIDGTPELEILASAPQALRVVELDGFNGDIFDELRDSFAYLTANGVSA